MKSKSNPSREPKSTLKRHGAGNGHGNGHGSAHGADGDGDAAAHVATHKPRGRREVREALEGQPPIAAILAGAASDGEGRGRMGRGLDRARLLSALLSFKKGDFDVRLPIDLEGVDGKIADAFNEVVEQNQRLSDEIERISRVVGKEGKISQRASIGEVAGSWADSIDSVN